MGVGIAGTVETHTNNGGRTEADRVRGYRAAMYLGVGLSGLGVLTSLLSLLKTHLGKAREEPAPEKHRTAE